MKLLVSFGTDFHLEYRDRLFDNTPSASLFPATFHSDFYTGEKNEKYLKVHLDVIRYERRGFRVWLGGYSFS